MKIYLLGLYLYGLYIQYYWPKSKSEPLLALSLAIVTLLQKCYLIYD